MVIIGRNPLTGEQEFFVNKKAAKLSGAIDVEEVEGKGEKEDKVVEVTTGVPTTSAGLAELANAEAKALDIIQDFLKTFEGSNIYGDDDDDDDDDPKFEEETQTYKPTKDDAAALYPYFPSNILDELIMKWTETGSIDIALATVIGGDAYAKAFPGIRREDNSLRMTEIQYLELKDSMKDQLRNYNLNPDVFANEIIEAITGDVNIQEFTARLQFGYEQLLNNKEQVLEVFNEQYGYGLDETVLFAMFISPDISQSVLENQILVSQILAEAEIATTEIGLSTAEKFVQANISQRDAAQVFSKTEELSGLVGVGARRGVSITEEDIATGLAGLSPQELALIRRTQATSASESSLQAGAVTTQEGQVTGLVEE
jgi:hypothetical protein